MHEKITRGRLLMRVNSSGGELVAERRVNNIVLRQGATIVAKLFAGVPTASAVTHVQLGFAREAAGPDTTALTPPDPPIPEENLRAAIAAESFRIIDDNLAAIKVAINALFRPTIELKDVSEAGLIAGTSLYNQVVFEPVTLRPGQDITLFWEVDFPFGR
jgi:hypothetical protein